MAFLSDRCRGIGSPIRLDDAGAVGGVDIELMPDGAAIASWIESVDQRAQFRIRRIEPSGAKSAAITVAGLAGGRSSGYPRIVANANEIVFAWADTSGATPRVQTAVARLPSSSQTRRTDQ
jgi:hypothetical protein